MTIYEFMAERRKQLDLSTLDLAKTAGMNTATVYKYLSGARAIPPERAQRLRDALCETPELRSRFDSLYQKSRPGKNRSPLELAIDSPNAELRIASLDYRPFSGDPRCFLDRFVEKCLELAVIGLEHAEPERISPDGPSTFDITERIEAIERRKVDLVFSLVSLQHMKKLAFIPIPIRIAVNGVLFHPRSSGKERPVAERLEAARNLLVRGEQRSAEPIHVVTIRNEVGHIFLEQTHHFTEAQDQAEAQNRDDLGIRNSIDAGTNCLYPQSTLDAGELSDKLKKLGRFYPSMLIADERTCLDVLGALGGDGVLVLPPNSDQAVIHSIDRRIPPCFYFGIGMRRANNSPLIHFLQQTFSTFLAVESETIAAWYEELYNQLVERARSWLSNSAIYIGGIHLTKYRLPTDNSRDPIHSRASDPDALKSHCETQIEQTARAFARRCLTLSRRSLESLPPEMAAWRPILERARERVQVASGGNRGHLRNIVFHSAKMALGKDPFIWESDPIALLRELEPAFESRDDRGLHLGPETGFHDGPSRSVPPESHWTNFLYLMELELDMDLSLLKEVPERWFFSSADLGRLISKIQVLMEASRDSQLVLTIRTCESQRDRLALIALWKDYLEPDRLPDPQSHIASNINQPGSYSLVAYHLGEPVGFLTAHIYQSESEDKGQDREPFDNTIGIRHLHVIHRMNHGGVSRRLIRRIIEEGNETLKKAIWTDRSLWNGYQQKKFERAGFVSADGNLLYFEYKLAETSKTIYPLQLNPANRLLRN